MQEEMPIPEPEDIEALMEESPELPATAPEAFITGEDPLVNSVVDGEVVVAEHEPPPPMIAFVTDGVTMTPLNAETNAAVKKSDIEHVNIEVRRPQTPLEVSVEEYAEIYNAQIKDLAMVIRTAMEAGGPEAGKLAAAEAISKQIQGLMKLISVSKIRWYAAERTFGALLSELDEKAAKAYRAETKTTRPKAESVKTTTKRRGASTAKSPFDKALATLMEIGHSEDTARAMLANIKNVPKE